jgi:hypothetical protein
MKIAEGARVNEIHGGGVVVFGFSRKSGNDIGTDGGVGQLFPDEVEAAGIVLGAVPAMHGGEDAVGGGLQGHVEMTSETWRRCEECDHVASDV